MIYFYLRLYVLGWLARNCNQTVVKLKDGLNVRIRITSLSITTISYEMKSYFERNKTYSWLESDVPPMQMHDRSSRTLLINLEHCVRHQNLTTFIFSTFTDIGLVYYYYYYYYMIWMSLVAGLFFLPAVIPTAQASSFTLQYFPYYVWCSKYSCLL